MNKEQGTAKSKGVQKTPQTQKRKGKVNPKSTKQPGSPGLEQAGKGPVPSLDTNPTLIN